MTEDRAPTRSNSDATLHTASATSSPRGGSCGDSAADSVPGSVRAYHGRNLLRHVRDNRQTAIAAQNRTRTRSARKASKEWRPIPVEVVAEGDAAMLDGNRHETSQFEQDMARKTADAKRNGLFLDIQSPEQLSRLLRDIDLEPVHAFHWYEETKKSVENDSAFSDQQREAFMRETDQWSALAKYLRKAASAEDIDARANCMIQAMFHIVGINSSRGEIGCPLVPLMTKLRMYDSDNEYQLALTILRTACKQACTLRYQAKREHQFPECDAWGYVHEFLHHRYTLLISKNYMASLRAHHRHVAGPTRAQKQHRRLCAHVDFKRLEHFNESGDMPPAQRPPSPYRGSTATSSKDVNIHKLWC